MKKYAALFSILMLGIAASPAAWAKPKTEIVVEVVSTQSAPIHTGVYNPGTSGSATTTCLPDGGPCYTDSTPGTPPSVTPITIYNEYVYAVMPGGRHVTLQCYVPCHPLPPGKYTAETDGGKVLHLHVFWPDPRNPNSPGKPGKLKYRIVGAW